MKGFSWLYAIYEYFAHLKLCYDDALLVHFPIFQI